MVRMVRVRFIFRDADGSRGGYGDHISEVSEIDVMVLCGEYYNDCDMVVFY